MLTEVVTIIRAGFAGAGKCGMSLAYYFRGKGAYVTGFSSRHGTDEFENFTCEELVRNSDIIFITVSDSDIPEIWERIKNLDLTDKIICHCSGSLSSGIFTGANPDRVCSVHPMLAFNSEHTSEKDIEKAYFTLEGGNTAKERVKAYMSGFPNTFIEIEKENKPLYHAAACFASNFVISVCETAERLLTDCGFSREDAHKALAPLMRSNMENIVNNGTFQSLTGPASRGDTETIDAHRRVLRGREREMYDLLTDVILDMKAGERK